jgi:hypothetical protein
MINKPLRAGIKGIMSGMRIRIVQFYAVLGDTGLAALELLLWWRR